MATLRDMVDGKTLDFAASPAAQHVAKHITDPFGAVKPQVDKLNKARMNYEMEKQNMRMQLAPVQKVTQGISNMHQLDGPGDGSPLDMSPNNPQNVMENQPPQPPMVDENGMVMGQPNLGSMTAPQGAVNTPNAPGAQIDEDGVPNNMGQTPGAKMNSNRPSLAGFQPGVSPGPAQSVVPGKMGTPQAGQGKPATVAGNPNPKNMPAGWTKPGQGPTNDPATYNKGAAPPKGNRALPGAKGPGDPKVANRTKKAQANSSGGSGRPIHVEVRADSMMARPAVSKVAQAASYDVLRTGSVADGKKCPKCGKVHAKGITACNMKAHKMTNGVMEARDFSQGRRKKLAKTGAALPGGGFPIVNKEDLKNAKQAIGRAKNPAAARKHINERARALGAKPIGMAARMANLTQ
jgi:hypothetical protein